MPAPLVRHVVGCMTGTSLDGLDAALLRIDGRGLLLRPTFLALQSIDFPRHLADDLRRLASGRPAPPIDYLTAARRLGDLHADVIAQLLAHHPLTPTTPPSPSPHECPSLGGTPPCDGVAPPTPPTSAIDRSPTAPHDLDFIVAHGQTIHHQPPAASSVSATDHRPSALGYSFQLLDPWPIVRRLRVPVCYDLRQADLLAGGQGAPVTPLADWLLYRSDQQPQLIVNLGGICNVTRLPPHDPALPAQDRLADIAGEDLGPCNLLIDGIVQDLFHGMKFDDGGTLAARGGASSIVERLLLQHPFFQRPRPRTTGREDFTADWAHDLRLTAGLEPYDLLASAVETVARLIDRHHAALPDPARTRLVLAGGGTRNHVLVRRIRQLARERGASAVLSDDLGIPAAAREAAAFALLGALSHDGLPITLPHITGSRSPGRAGAWVYP